MPVVFGYLEIETADSVAVQTVRTRQSTIEATREAGDEWLASRRTALLRVPSVIVPATWNLLINPHHPDSAHIRIARTHYHGFDPRLKK